MSRKESVELRLARREVTLRQGEVKRLSRMLSRREEAASLIRMQFQAENERLKRARDRLEELEAPDA